MKAIWRHLNVGRLYYFSFVIFAAALIVRIFIWQDVLLDIWKVQTGLVEIYHITARLLVEDGVLSLFEPNSKIADPELLGHPLGYPLLLAPIFKLFGESNTMVQCVSVFFDALSAVLIFRIINKLISFKAAVVTGLLAAFSPSFALNSVFPLPDTLSVFPILASVYFLVRFYEKPACRSVILSGVCLGISCWLRSNSLLLPLFFAAAVLFLCEGKIKFAYAGALILSAVLIVAPITIRNAVVYGEFIPISLGAGQILLEGIGDYDKEQKFGIPYDDYGIGLMEAKMYNRPDYAKTLFGPDGIKRDRLRVKQAEDFVKNHPFWFAERAIQRAFSMFKLEPAQKVSSDVPVTTAVSEVNSPDIVWQFSPANSEQNIKVIAPGACLSKPADALILETDETRRDPQISINTSNLESNRQYIFKVTQYLKKGRTSLRIIGLESGKIYNSVIIYFYQYNELNGITFEETIIPFVLSREEPVEVLISNEPSDPPGSVFEIKQASIQDMGEATLLWTRPLRYAVHLIQKIFTTAVIIPFTFLGLLILIRKRRKKVALILMTVPIYYFCTQSILHTEYRYVLALHYFTFALAAVGFIKLLELTVSYVKRFFHLARGNKFNRLAN